MLSNEAKIKEYIRALEQFKETPGLAPSKLLADLVTMINPSYICKGLHTVGGEAYLLRCTDPSYPASDIAIKIPFSSGYLGEGQRTIVTRDGKNPHKLPYAVTCFNPSDRRFLDGSVLQRALFRAIKDAGIHYFCVPEVYAIHNNPPILEMEWVESVQALYWFREKPNLIDKLHCFCNLLRFAQFIHERNIIHRDLSPDNILIGPYGSVCVIDWSMAKEIGNRNLTAKGVGMGKPPYASFVQAVNANDATQLDEIYYLGWSFAAFLLDRDMPIPDDPKETNYKRIQAKLREKILQHPLFPSEFKKIFSIATEAEESRYQSADEFLTDVMRVLDKLRGEKQAKKRDVWELQETKYPSPILSENAIDTVVLSPKIDIDSISKTAAEITVANCAKANKATCTGLCSTCFSLNESLGNIIINTVFELKRKGLL